MLESSLLGVITALAVWVQDPQAATPGGERGAQLVGTESDAGLDATYTARHALVIGIDKYDDTGFPRLGYAVADAKAVADVLVKRYGFPTDNVRLITNEAATRDALSQAFEDWASDPKRVGENDLLLVFFAGHGQTRRSPTGERGYLVPCDARTQRGETTWSTLLGMDELGSISKFIPAKHVLLLLDCCFGGAVSERGPVPIAAGLSIRARQILTAGGADQTVLDGGAEGHSVFTAALLDGLRGSADGNLDQVVTFGELYDYVTKRVEAETAKRQTPLRLIFPDDKGGNVALFPPGIKPPKLTAIEQLKQLELRADELLAENDRLSDIVVVQQLEEQAETLWPRRPEKIPAMRGWLGRAREVQSRLPVHEASLARIQQQGFLSQVVAGTIEDKSDSQVDWNKADPKLRWRYDSFSNLVSHLRGLDPLITDIEKRLEVASVIEAKTVDEQTDAWNAAQEAIGANPLYHGLELEPQIGLVPLGEDPDSHLWEFWVWESGERPERDEATKRWKITGETGLVLVLLPGGTFSMGAQKENPLGPNYDPLAIGNESPVSQVPLAPFFLSKYEMTQGQWRRVAGANPSYWKHPEEGMPGAHPVEQVSYGDCVMILGRLDLVLPTESQWEYAARGGTTTPWWTGGNKETLKDAGNLADESYRKGFNNPLAWENWDDGFDDSAPVGAFRANGFGLHDVVGNVWEWCRDWWGAYTLPVKPGDGERSVEGASNRVLRGGCFLSTATDARSAIRHYGTPELRNGILGCRPARSISHP